MNRKNKGDNFNDNDTALILVSAVVGLYVGVVLTLLTVG